MDPTAPHSARTEPPASPRESRSSTPMPPCIAAILGMVRVLLGYGKHLDATLPDRTDHSGFSAIAIGFGTHDLRRILAHVQRGILRALMLQKSLRARAAQGRKKERAAQGDNTPTRCSRLPTPVSRWTIPGSGSTLDSNWPHSG